MHYSVESNLMFYQAGVLPAGGRITIAVYPGGRGVQRFTSRTGSHACLAMPDFSLFIVSCTLYIQWSLEGWAVGSLCHAWLGESHPAGQCGGFKLKVSGRGNSVYLNIFFFAAAVKGRLYISPPGGAPVRVTTPNPAQHHSCSQTLVSESAIPHILSVAVPKKLLQRDSQTQISTAKALLMNVLLLQADFQ